MVGWEWQEEKRGGFGQLKAPDCSVGHPPVQMKGEPPLYKEPSCLDEALLSCLWVVLVLYKPPPPPALAPDMVHPSDYLVWGNDLFFRLGV